MSARSETSIPSLLGGIYMGEFTFNSSSLLWEKSKVEKHPFGEEPHLLTGCCFYHPRTHLPLQLQRTRFLLSRVNNQCINSKDSLQARATTLCFTERHTPRCTSGISAGGRTVPTDVRATLKLETRVCLKPVFIFSNR